MVPWSVFWERNLFLERFALVQAVFLDHFVRGAISGVGLVCLGAAVAELTALWRSRSAGAESTEPATADGDTVR